MDEVLAERIKRVYSEGVLGERADSELGANEQDARIDAALQILANVETVTIARLPWTTPCYEFAITSRDDPSFDQWITGMGNAQKLDWISRNDRPYVVLWFRVSRVADYFYSHFNHWIPRGDTGYLDADFNMQPDARWSTRSELMANALQAQGFVYATDELLAMRIPFVLDHDYDSIPDDDPRWDDDDFEPPLVLVSFHECMFGT